METAEVHISDLEPRTVELLLQYCYGRLAEMPSDHCEVCASSLLVASLEFCFLRDTLACLHWMFWNL
jgi:hypothetical protein